MKLLHVLNTEEEIQAGYVDMLDFRLDPSIPGLLLEFALSNDQQHRMPPVLLGNYSKLQ